MPEIKREPAPTESVAEVNPASEIVQDYKFGFHETEKHTFRTKKGLSRQVVEEISALENQLNASYKVTSSLMSMSLLSYL